MIQPSNAELRFSQRPGRLGSDVFTAELRFFAETTRDDKHFSESEIIIVEEELRQKLYKDVYGVLIKALQNARQVSLDSSFDIEGSKAVELSFERVFKLFERSDRSNLRISLQFKGRRDTGIVFTGEFGVYSKLMLDWEFVSDSDHVRQAELVLRQNIQEFLYGDLIAAIVNEAYLTSLRNARPGRYDCVKLSFEPVFELMKIKMRCSERVNYTSI